MKSSKNYADLMIIDGVKSISLFFQVKKKIFTFLRKRQSKTRKIEKITLLISQEENSPRTFFQK